MFVVALVPFKSHCYFLKFIYHVKNIGQLGPSAGNRTHLTYFSKPWYCVLCTMHCVICSGNKWWRPRRQPQFVGR